MHIKIAKKDVTVILNLCCGDMANMLYCIKDFISNTLIQSLKNGGLSVNFDLGKMRECIGKNPMHSSFFAPKSAPNRHQTHPPILPRAAPEHFQNCPKTSTKLPQKLRQKPETSYLRHDNGAAIGWMRVRGDDGERGRNGSVGKWERREVEEWKMMSYTG